MKERKSQRYVSDKGLALKYIKNTKNSILKNELKIQQSLHKTYINANKYMKSYSTPLVITGIQIKPQCDTATHTH